MSNNHFTAFEITEKGLALRQKAIAEGFTVDFTRGSLGQGRPADGTDLFGITGLIDPIIDVPIKESYAREKNHIMAIVIDAVNFIDDIMMTEIGIYARLLDPDTKDEIMPEVLYGYTFTNKYEYIPAGEEYNLYREISFNTVLSRSGKFKITYDKTKVYVTRDEIEKSGAVASGYDNKESGLNGTNVQEAIDELTTQSAEITLSNVSLTNNLVEIGAALTATNAS